jgi:hypothetical protein
MTFTFSIDVLYAVKWLVVATYLFVSGWMMSQYRDCGFGLQLLITVTWPIMYPARWMWLAWLWTWRKT